MSDVAVRPTPTNIIIVSPQGQKQGQQGDKCAQITAQNQALQKKVEILSAFATVQNNIIDNLMKKQAQSKEGDTPQKVDYNA